jgi:hypothetical protein
MLFRYETRFWQQHVSNILVCVRRSFHRSVFVTIQCCEDGDLTKVQSSALVNAANVNLQHGGGIAAALRNAGGPSIQDESNAIIQRNGTPMCCIRQSFAPLVFFHVKVL